MRSSGLSLRHIDIVIPYRQASDEREENLYAVLNHLALTYCDYRIWLVEADVTPKFDWGRAGNSNLRHVFIPHEGPFPKAVLCNAGAKLSTSPVTCFHDADSVAHPARMMSAVAALLDGQDSDALCPYERVVNVSGDLRRNFLADPRFGPLDELNVEPLPADATILYRSANGGVLLFRRAAYAAVGGYDENLEGWGGEDDELCIRATRLGMKWHSLLGQPLIHLHHDTSSRDDAISSTRNSRNVLTAAEVAELPVRELQDLARTMAAKFHPPVCDTPVAAQPPLYPLVDTRHGRFFVNRNDTYVGQSLRRYGEWSEPEIALFEQIVQPGDVAVEAGANLGSHTVWLARRVGDAGAVHAFEPARHTFQLLCANLVANDCLNVVALQQAVGAEVSQLDFPVLDPRQSWNFGGASMKNRWTDRAERVSATTLDALSLSRVDFIKADVEGFEIEVLRGASRTIASHRPAVYLEINTAEVRNEAVRFFDALGYACWYYITPMFSPANWARDRQDIFNDYSFDMLCLPGERYATSGLTRAGVDDGRVSYLPGQIHWATDPWQAAKVQRLS